MIKTEQLRAFPAIFTRFSHMLFGRATPLLYANSSFIGMSENKQLQICPLEWPRLVVA